MWHRHTFLGPFVAAACACALGCNSSTPNSPTSSIPTISSASPAQLQVSASPQTVLLVGQQFQDGLVVNVTRPDGSLAVLTGSSIQSVSSVQFQMSVLLDLAGNYTIVVENPDHEVSLPFILVAGVNAGSVTPVVASVVPSVLSASTAQQIITVSGQNFDLNLTLSLTLPDGSVALFGPSVAFGVSTTSCAVSTTFQQTGTYFVAVIDSNGVKSNMVPLTVK